MKSGSFRKESEKAETEIFKNHNDNKIKIHTYNPLSDEPATDNSIPKSCENPKFVRSEESKVLRVGDSQQNEGSRDFNIR